MTLDHIAALYFSGKREAAKKRVQKLKAAGLLSERPRRVSEPSILSLSGSAIALLKEQGLLAGFPRLSQEAMANRTRVSHLTLQHELEVLSIKATIVPAVSVLLNFKVAEFSTWPRLNEFDVPWSAIDPNRMGRLTVKPDGFIRIHETESDGSLYEHTFYLEHDRSTESQTVLAAKARAYLEHYRTGGLAVRHGRPRTEYKEFPFRVLMVLQSTDRLNNTIERLLANTPPTLTQVWLTTFAEITSDPLGPIWVRPKDYRDEVRGAAKTEPTKQCLVGEQGKIS